MPFYDSIMSIMQMKDQDGLLQASFSFLYFQIAAYLCLLFCLIVLCCPFNALMVGIKEIVLAVNYI